MNFVPHLLPFSLIVYTRLMTFLKALLIVRCRLEFIEKSHI